MLAARKQIIGKEMVRNKRKKTEETNVKNKSE
jgi:hypothetical protein